NQRFTVVEAESKEEA
ncbi:DUF1381 domain-containing protein, partial [Staphylococcus aureus]